MSFLNFLKFSKKQPDPAILFRRQLTYRFWLFVGMIIITALALFFLSRSINSTVSVVKALRGDHRWFIKNNDTIASLFTEQTKAKELQNQLNKIIPRAVDVPGFVITQFQKDAIEKNIDAIITVDKNGDRSFEGASVVQLSIVGSGVFQNINSFFKSLENEAPRVKINSFSITPGDGGLFRFQVNIFVYVQPY